MTQEEKAADKHIRKVVDAAGHPGWDWTTQDISEAFIAGATWQKEQMLKGARNHFVYNILSGNDMKKMIGIYNDEVSCKPGDVVRVIVLPKEDQTNG